MRHCLYKRKQEQQLGKSGFISFVFTAVLTPDNQADCAAIQYRHKAEYVNKGQN